MSATEDRFSAWMRSLYRHIEEDFGLADREPTERAKLLEGLVSMVMQGAFARAVELLGDDDGSYLENMLAGDGANDREKQQYAAMFVVSKVPDFGSLMEEAYAEVQSVCLEVTRENREKKFEAADKDNEDLGDLTESIEGGIEDAGIEVPGLSVLSAGIDLLYDPAKFGRTPEERQERLFKHGAILISKALVIAWFGLLFFTILDTLEHFHVIGRLPKLLREAVPNWYERQTIGGQMSTLGILAVGGILLVFIVTFIFIRLAKSTRLTPAFEMKVSDDELASGVIRSLLTSTCPSIVTEKNVWESSKIVYKTMYQNYDRSNSDGLKMLAAILDDGNERAAVAFLKSKMRGYKEEMRYRAEEFCRTTATVMGDIG